MFLDEEEDVDEMISNDSDYEKIITESLDKYGKLTQFAINQLFQRDDCFVISAKNGWKNSNDLQKDISNIFNRNMEVKFIVIPDTNGGLKNNFISSTLENYYDKPEEILIKGDSYNIIGSFI